MRQEIPYLHVLRVVACIMVICLHSLPTIQTTGVDYYFSVGVMLITRPCVPLFLMITGVLLLPYQDTDIIAFYKKRILRILFPLIVWGVVYSILPNLIGVENLLQMGVNLSHLLIDYPHEIGGILWYLYILIGIYMIIPFINHAVFESEKMQRIYLIFWFIASLVGLLKCYNSQVLGMTPFCEFDFLLYFSGYLGYLFLGKYLHTSTNSIRGKKLMLIYPIVYLLSMILIYVIGEDKNFLYMRYFLSFGAIIMTACLFCFIKNISFNINVWYYRIIKNKSALSFGIYLTHMAVYRTITCHLYYHNTHPLTQITVMILTFGGAYVLTWGISKLSYSKYVIG